MKYVISPAKTLDLDSQPPVSSLTVPEHLEYAAELISTLRQKTPADIASLMKLSDKLSTLNVERYQSWQQLHNSSNSRPALFTFMGDVYTGLDAYSLTADQITSAQQNLRILSGLYGILRPLDLIQPYRLEMGTKLENAKGKDLYQFWGTKIAEFLNQEMDDDEVLVNLASNEYFKAVSKQHLNHQIITPNFLDEKNGQYKVISFYAKKARGMMVRFLLTNAITNPEDLKAFDYSGYRYDASRSTALEPVFIRPESAQEK